MSLKEQLIEFGCGSEFIEIALCYASHYNPDEEIERFIEFVEENHAKVEAAEALAEKEQEVVDAAALLREFEDQPEG